MKQSIMEGQLWPKERELLYQTVNFYNPSISFEIGTWKGGGSTNTIISALRSKTPTKAELHTCEIDPYFYAEACYNHHTITQPGYNITPDGVGYFYCYPGIQVLQTLINTGRTPDFAFLDGPEDPENNLIDFLFLEKNVRPGCIVAIHDYDLNLRTDGNISIKCQLLRPYIETHNSWQVLNYLTEPISVGMVVMIKI